MVEIPKCGICGVTGGCPCHPGMTYPAPESERAMDEICKHPTRKDDKFDFWRCVDCGYIEPKSWNQPKPNEPTLTCSEVVERLPISVRTFEFGFQWKQPHDAAYHIGLAAFSHAEILEFAEAYAAAVLHSARDWGKIGYQQADDEYKKVCVLERRVQELEEALEMCMGVIWSEFHTGPTDDMTGDNEADIAYRAGKKALEWREQIRKGQL